MTLETMTVGLGALLSHTTGILLADIDDVSNFQDFEFGVSLMTHERVFPEYDTRGRILSVYPELMNMTPPRGAISTQEEADLWIEMVSEESGVPLVVEWERIGND